MITAANMSIISLVNSLLKILSFLFRLLLFFMESEFILKLGVWCL